jgi:predicted transcriptional regulator
MTGGTQILRLLSGETCFKVVNILMSEPDFTTSLSKKLDIESSRITHTLKNLEKNDLVSTYREKKLKYYQLKHKKKIHVLMKIVAEIQNE